MTAVVGAAHEAGVERLLDSYRAIPPGERVRLAKRTSNLFRARAASTVPGLDTSGLTGVVDVDPEARTADVQGMCTYEDLVDATLPHGLSPLVVPQLRTITLGGAVTGLGIESASWRNGLPHESVLEMDVLTGAGEVVTTDAGSRHPDLFRGFANSYGTLGYATRLRIELEPVGRFVTLRHVRFTDLDELVTTLGSVLADGAFDGEPVDYVDGVVFSASESYLVLGARSDEPGPTSDYTGQQRLLPLDPARRARAPARPAHDPRLPVALGHRLVLVLAGLRGAAPDGPPALAEAVAAQQRLLEADRARPAVRRRRPPRGAPRTAPARTGRAGRRGPARRHRRVPALVPARGADRADLAVPVAASQRRAVVPLPAAPG